MMEKTKRIVIALGSNVEQEAHTGQAKELLSSHFRNLRFSTPLWTEPIGMPGSDKFLNLVAVGYTNVFEGRAQVEAILKEIERRCGRIRGEGTKGLVAMDLDLLLYGDEICHPRDWERDYIKKSLSELGIS